MVYASEKNAGDRISGTCSGSISTRVLSNVMLSQAIPGFCCCRPVGRGDSTRRYKCGLTWQYLGCDERVVVDDKLPKTFTIVCIVARCDYLYQRLADVVITALVCIG